MDVMTADTLMHETMSDGNLLYLSKDEEGYFIAYRGRIMRPNCSPTREHMLMICTNIQVRHIAETGSECELYDWTTDGQKVH